MYRPFSKSLIPYCRFCFLCCLYSVALFCSFCNSPQAESGKIPPLNIKRDTVQVGLFTGEVKDSSHPAPSQLYPVVGYRFHISGDFDGDGRPEMLTEHFYSRKEHKEITKFYEGLDYDELVYQAGIKAPVSFLSSTNKLIPNLKIAEGTQLFGISYLKNEGDLNGDGTDELSYVVDWADWSSLNTCHVMTFSNKKWQEIFTFGIWDWQLPDLPQAMNTYGLFGLEAKEAIPKDEQMNLKLQADLNAFPGFIKKISPHKIQVIYRSEDSNEDTTVVDLRKQKKLRQ